MDQVADSVTELGLPLFKSIVFLFLQILFTFLVQLAQSLLLLYSVRLVPLVQAFPWFLGFPRYLGCQIRLDNGQYQRAVPRS